MRKEAAVISIGIALGAGAAVSTSPVWFHHLFNAGALFKSLPFSQPQVDNLVLYAELNEGFLVGKSFNRNSDVTVDKITVEAVPKDEKNFFNQFTPASSMSASWPNRTRCMLSSGLKQGSLILSSILFVCQRQRRSMKANQPTAP
jgi:hypothetical protein